MRTELDHPELSRRREKRAMYAASLFNGPAELLDFVLPLWAGLALGATAAQVGVLMAVEMAVSVLVRPLAGILADRVERRGLAGAGALLYALSCAGYAFAGGVPAAMGAAVLGGLGGAVFWVALRAMVAERLPRDPAVFPRLLAAEETGSWIAFVAAMSTMSLIGFRAVFLACAAACAAAAVALFSGPRRVEPPAPPIAGGIAALGRKLWPMLPAVVTTMAAEAAVGLLLLLRLQRDFGLSVPQIALVFLPGGIAVSVLPPHLHRFTARFGRRAVLASASLSSAAFAASLAWAPNPWAIGALWILSGAAWAAVIPIQQAVIAEASGGERVGRGMGLYESACLIGALIGSLFAGLLFDGPGWIAACLASAAVIAGGAVLMPFAVKRLGVADRPAPSVEETRAPEPEPTPEPELEPEPERRPEPGLTPKRRLVRLGGHAAVFAVAQVTGAFLGLSWLWDLLGGTRELADALTGPPGGLTGVEQALYKAGTVWVFVLLAEAVWTAWNVMRPRRD